MTEQKHTPGPWVVDPDSPTDISPADDLSLGIASISHVDQAGRWFFGEQSKANAKLIAAAPDLLEALIAAEAMLVTAEHHLDLGQDDSVVFEPEILAARAAIAKATQ